MLQGGSRTQARRDMLGHGTVPLLQREGALGRPVPCGLGQRLSCPPRLLHRERQALRRRMGRWEEPHEGLRQVVAQVSEEQETLPCGQHHCPGTQGSDFCRLPSLGRQGPGSAAARGAVSRMDYYGA